MIKHEIWSNLLYYRINSVFKSENHIAQSDHNTQQTIFEEDSYKRRLIPIKRIFLNATDSECPHPTHQR